MRKNRIIEVIRLCTSHEGCLISRDACSFSAECKFHSFVSSTSSSNDANRDTAFLLYLNLSTSKSAKSSTESFAEFDAWLDSFLSEACDTWPERKAEFIICPLGAERVYGIWPIGEYTNLAGER